MLDIKNKQTIINSYLRGNSLREIGELLDLSKDTAAKVINEWKSGTLNYLQDGVPYEKSLIEISKFLKESNMDLNDAISFSFNLKMMLDRDIDKEQSIMLLQNLKDMKQDELISFIETANTLFKKGKRYGELNREVEELEFKKSANEKKIESQTRQIRELKIKLADIKNQEEIHAKRLAEVQKNEYFDKEKLKKSKFIFSRVKKLGIGDDKIFQFLQGASIFMFNPFFVVGAESLCQELPPGEDASTHMLNILLMWASIKEAGWDITSAIEFAKAFKKITGSESEAIKVL